MSDDGMNYFEWLEQFGRDLEENERSRVLALGRAISALHAALAPKSVKRTNRNAKKSDIAKNATAKVGAA